MKLNKFAVPKNQVCWNENKRILKKFMLAFQEKKKKKKEKKKTE